jgi:5-methylcytosine-specific restriction endonuclease McrA
MHPYDASIAANRFALYGYDVGSFELTDALTRPRGFDARVSASLRLYWAINELRRSPEVSSLVVDFDPYRFPANPEELFLGAIVGYRIESKECSECRVLLPASSTFFGHTPSGNLRGQCKVCMARQTAEHSRKNPDMVAQRQARRRQRLSEAGGELDVSSKRRIKESLRTSQQDCCWYCGEPLLGGGELDHKTPIARGGRDNALNLALACLVCNRDKADKTVEEFMAWRKAKGLQIGDASSFRSTTPAQSPAPGSPPRPRRC